MFGNMGYNMNGWGYSLALVGALVFWSLLCLAAFAIWRGASHRVDRPGLSPRRSEELLAERYARGELDEDEYRKHLAVLRDNVSLTKGG